MGVNERTEGQLIGTKHGAVKCRTYKPMGSHEERWNLEEINKIKGTPWQLNPNKRGYELKPRAIMPDQERAPLEGARTKIRTEAKYKGLYIYKSDVEKFGYTTWCDRVKEGN